MRRKRDGRTSQFTRSKRVSVTFIFLLAAAVGTPTLFWARRVEAATTLDPASPGNFSQDGTQTVTPGAVLTITDQSVGDTALLFANDSDAVPGVEVDVIATFKVKSTNPNNVDVGNRVVINDATRAAIAACIIKNGVSGIGLLSQGPWSDPESYPVFVPVEFQATPVTIRLRRHANGDAELVEVNGVAPHPRALLSAALLAPATHSFTTVEFGAASPEARCTVEYSAFRSERVVQPVSGTLNFTRFRVRDNDSIDHLRFRAD